MNFSRIITAVDSHTSGEPTRIVTGGIPVIPGASMRQKKEWLAEHCDVVRRCLMWEPRGHKDMFGAIITAPASGDADVGVLFMDGGGYLDMCGHGSIGTVTVLVEMGMMAGREIDGRREVVLDTPAGIIRAAAAVKNHRVQGVSIQNVPCFHYAALTVALEDVGSVPIDIAYGGNFFAIVNVAHLGITIDPDSIPGLIELGLRIRQAAKRSLDIVHPADGRPGEVNLVEIYDESCFPPKNIVIFGRGQIDRSPCGTGTSAKMATLHHYGKLAIGETYRYSSVLGTEFQGRLIGQTRVGDRDAVLPEITGRAFITGIQQFVVDDEDPLRDGFCL